MLLRIYILVCVAAIVGALGWMVAHPQPSSATTGSTIGNVVSTTPADARWQRQLDVAIAMWGQQAMCGSVKVLTMKANKTTAGMADSSLCVIYIDVEAMKNMNDNQRCLLMAHEFGHLVKYVSGHVPRSIMSENGYFYKLNSPSCNGKPQSKDFFPSDYRMP